jgi:exonuclease SbcC
VPVSLTLVKVELSNIRSHKHVIFEPSEVGVTAISGPNGSGKSTIVDSLAWCLWGTKPNGVSRAMAIIREGTDVGPEKCFARVEIKLDHSNLLIERRIISKNGAVECDVWERRTDENDFGHVAGPAVSHAEPYIRKRLKMDEKGFLAAIFVQQKQVDQLISASPRERAEVIEKLTGISSITAALIESRQQYNSLRGALKHSSIDEEGLETLKKEAVTLKKDLATKTLKRDQAEITLAAAEEKVTLLSKQVETEEVRETLTQKLKNDLLTVTATITSKEEELARLTTLKENKKKQLTVFSKGQDLKTIENTLIVKRNSHRDRDRESDRLEQQIKGITAQITTFEETIEKSSIKDLPTAEERLKGFKTKLEVLKSKETLLLGRISDLRALLKTIENAKDIITNESGSCPTCLQHVSDPTIALAGLETESAAHLQTLEENDALLRQVKENLPKVEEGISKFLMLISSLQGLNENREKLNTLIQERGTIEGQVAALAAELVGIEKAYVSARRNVEVKEEYDTLLASAVAASDLLEELTRKRNTINEELKVSGNDSAGKLQTLRGKLTASSNIRNSALIAYSNLKETTAVLEAQAVFMEERISKSEDEVTRYKALLKNVEVAANSIEVIEEFREERIRTSVPIVGVFASDLLTRFTEGKFTQFKLDEKFNASVVLANGSERQVGLLSGGELSAAAISLRLAISMLLNSGNANNMVILDEVLVSQDGPRAEQILATIKEVCQGQVLMISHGPNTTEIADKVVELKP